jgi:hypothetical protein
LAAQAPGLPVHGGGFRGGSELIGTIGWSGVESQAGGRRQPLRVRLAYGWSRVGLAGTFGLVSGTLSQATAGALVGLRLLGDGVQSPFEVGAFGGAGLLFGGSCAEDAATSTGPCDEAGDWRIPLGASFAVAITTPYVSIRPWLAPRAEIFEALDEEKTVTKFAGSAGVDLRFAGGFGVRLLWEKVESQDQTLASACPIVSSRGVGMPLRYAALVLTLLSATACAQTFDATTLGVPVTMAAPPADQPVGEAFKVNQSAVYAFWGLATLTTPRLDKALATQLIGGKSVSNVKMKVRARWSDVLITALTLGRCGSAHRHLRRRGHGRYSHHASRPVIVI